MTFNQETKIYESNVIPGSEDSNVEMNYIDQIKNYQNEERPNRETDLMDLDLEIDGEESSESVKEKEISSEISESESFEMDNLNEEQEFPKKKKKYQNPCL